MKKIYSNADVQVTYLKDEDVLTISVLSSNSDLIEDGKDFEELFRNDL